MNRLGSTNAIQDDMSRTQDIFGLKENANTANNASNNGGGNTSSPPDLDSISMDDQGNVSDGSNANPSGGQDTGAEGNPPDLDNMNMDDQGNVTEGGEGGDVPGSEETEDDMMEDDPDETTDSAKKEEVDHAKLSVQHKERLKNKMVYLYRIIKGDIELLNNYNCEHDDQTTIGEINCVIDNLTAANKAMYNILIKDLNQIEYADLLRVYVGVEKIYDISITMINAHFDKIRKIRDEELNKQKKNTNTRKYLLSQINQ